MLQGIARDAQGQQQTKTEVKKKSVGPRPSVGSVGKFSSPVAYRLVTRISNSQRLSSVEKDGLLKTVAVADDFAKTDSMRSKMLNSIAAVASFLEVSAGPNVQVKKPTESQVQQSVARSKEFVNNVQKRLQASDNKPKTDAAAQVSVRNELDRLVQRSRNVDVKEAIEVGKEGIREFTGHAVDEIVEGVGAAKQEVDAPRVDIKVPGSGSGADVPQIVAPGQGPAVDVAAKVAAKFVTPGSGEQEIQPKGQLVDIKVPGSGASALDSLALKVLPEAADLKLPGQLSSEEVAILNEQIEVLGEQEVGEIEIEISEVIAN